MRPSACTRSLLVALGAAMALLLSSGSHGLVAPPLDAQTSSVDDALLGAYRWRSIGPDRGGRSIAVAGVKGRPREAYFGAVGGGLWKTIDAGNTWAPVTDGQISELLGRRRRGLGVESRHRLHRHGRVVHPRQHHARRRRLQVRGRRQDLGERRLCQRRCHLEDPHPPDQPRHRLRRGVRPVLRPERRARRLQEHRRRQDLAADAVPRSAHRRGRYRDRRQQPERAVCCALGGVPHRVPDVERRPWQRPLQEHRRRRDLDRDHAQPGPATGCRRPHRRRAHHGRFQSRLRARRKRQGRPVRVRRRRARPGG